jgi:hypothetical protein
LLLAGYIIVEVTIMKKISKLLVTLAVAGAATFSAGTASAFFGMGDWFDDDDWYDGPYYGHPGYGYGGYPGYGYGGYPGYGYGGYPGYGYGGGYPGYGYGGGYPGYGYGYPAVAPAAPAAPAAQPAAPAE